MIEELSQHGYKENETLLMYYGDILLHTFINSLISL